MRDMTRKEITELGKDMIDAKIGVFVKHGFSVEEISNLIGISEKIVEKIINRLGLNNELHTV